MAFDSLPVVRSGLPRLARVGEHDPLLEVPRINIEGDTLDAIHAKLDGRNAAVHGRPIVLYASRHTNRLTFDVHSDLQNVVGIHRRAGEPCERSAERDGQRRGAGNAGAGR